MVEAERIGPVLLRVLVRAFEAGMASLVAMSVFGFGMLASMERTSEGEGTFAIAFLLTFATAATLLVLTVLAHGGVRAVRILGSDAGETVFGDDPAQTVETVLALGVAVFPLWFALGDLLADFGVVESGGSAGLLAVGAAGGLLSVVVLLHAAVDGWRAAVSLVRSGWRAAGP